MIEKTEINGKKATIAYLDAEMQPATLEDAVYVKIIYEDGRRVFAAFDKPEVTPPPP